MRMGVQGGGGGRSFGFGFSFGWLWLWLWLMMMDKREVGYDRGGGEGGEGRGIIVPGPL
jgi:hypothetical protein